MFAMMFCCLCYWLNSVVVDVCLRVLLLMFLFGYFVMFALWFLLLVDVVGCYCCLQAVWLAGLVGYLFRINY